MLHYGRSIRQFGPPSQYSTIRFEGKHGQFKKTDRSINNHVNLTYSLTSKHQDLQFFYLSSNNYFDTNKLGSKQKLKLTDIMSLNDFFNNLFEINNLNKNGNLFKWLVHENIEYHIDDFLCFNCEPTQHPQFGQIKHIVKRDNKIYFFLLEWETLTYARHLMSYIVKKKKNVLPEFR
jgi:hypothetical protein